MFINAIETNVLSNDSFPSVSSEFKNSTCAIIACCKVLQGMVCIQRIITVLQCKIQSMQGLYATIIPIDRYKYCKIFEYSFAKWALLHSVQFILCKEKRIFVHIYVWMLYSFVEASMCYSLISHILMQQFRAYFEEAF